MKIGVPPYVNPETTTGGVALKFYSSVRLEVRSVGSIKSPSGEGEIMGAKTRVKIVKNKFAPPFKKVEFPIIFGLGISAQDILLDLAVENEVVKKAGSWFSYGEIRLGQGSEKTKDFLNENPEVKEEIKQKLLAIVSPANFDDSGDEDEVLEENIEDTTEE